MRAVLMGDVGCIKLVNQFLFPCCQPHAVAQLPCQYVQAAQRIDHHAVLPLAVHLHKALPHMSQFKRQLRKSGSERFPIKRMLLRSVEMLALHIAIGCLCRTLELFVGKVQQGGG